MLRSSSDTRCGVPLRLGSRGPETVGTTTGPTLLAVVFQNLDGLALGIWAVSHGDASGRADAGP